MNKLIFYIAIGLIIAFELFYLSSQRKSQTDKDLSPPVKQTADKKPESVQEQSLKDFYLVDAKNQKKELEVWSVQAHKAMGSTQWSMDQVKANIYSGEVTYTVTGAKGVVDEIKKTMTIEGDVKMISNNGYQFNTQHLNYDPEKKKITTDDKVTMESTKEGPDKLFMEGVGLDVNLENNLMVLQNSVVGQKPMSGGRMMKITSQQAEMSGTKKSMAFRNDVVIRSDQMVVKGTYADFRYKEGKLDTLYMDGGIHLQDQDKIGSSGIAIVYFNEDKYVFKKKPFITQGENELIGDEIVVFNGGKRVQVKNAKMEYHQNENENENEEVAPTPFSKVPIKKAPKK